MIVIKGLKDQQIQRHELDAINNNGTKGLLYLEISEKRSSFKLIYDVTGFISLQKLLAAPQNKDSFVKILIHIQRTLQSMEDAHFDTRRLLLDFDKVMVNPATGEIRFAYVPIQPFESGVSLRNFMLDISAYCIFPAGEDTSFVEEYIRILNKGVNFSLFELEQYIKELSTGEKHRHRSENICPKCSAVVQDGANFCVACGEKLRGKTDRTGAPEHGVYDPLEYSTAARNKPEYDGSDYNAFGFGSSGHGTQGYGSNDYGTFERDAREYSFQGQPETHKPKERRTTFLGAERPTRRTTALGSGELDRAAVACLIRKRNGERIVIDRDLFRIGFSWDTSDYAISDNEAISTKHAQILCRNERYYVIDVGSTNHTYVDGRMIPKMEEMEIYSGTKLRFANEDFQFQIDDGR